MTITYNARPINLQSLSNTGTIFWH